MSRESLKMNVLDDLQVASRSDTLRQKSDCLMKELQDMVGEISDTYLPDTSSDSDTSSAKPKHLGGW